MFIKDEIEIIDCLQCGIAINKLYTFMKAWKLAEREEWMHISCVSWKASALGSWCLLSELL